VDFQIRLFRADGRLSVVLNIEAVGERDARLQALHLVQGDIVRAEIFTNKGLLNIYRRVSPDDIANDNVAVSAESGRNASDIHLH
jgi:hypothetical protein